MPPHRLFLQTAEATKLATDAGLKATEAVAKGGSSASVTWFLFLLALISLAILAVLFWKELKSKHADIQAAVQKVREECAKENAINIGHEQASKQELKDYFEQTLSQVRLEKKELQQQILDNNNELRLQIRKDAQVLEATANSLRAITKTTQANNTNQQEMLRVLAIIAPLAQVRPALPPELL